MLRSIILSKRKLSYMLVLAFVFLASSGWAATYYVDATNGKDTNTGLSEAGAWKTIAKVNSSTFNPGDQVLFKRGEVWREQFTIPASGAAGYPITFTAYGSGDKPVISGADIVKDWIKQTGTVYSKGNVTTKPKTAFYNNAGLRRTTGAVANMGTNEWQWDSDTLYINVGENPANGTVEISQRNYGIYANGINYVTIDSLMVKYCSLHNIQVTGTNVVIQNCDISYGAAKGLVWATNSANVDINNNTIHHNGFGRADAYGCGIFTWKDAGSLGKENYIRNNTIYGNTNYGIYIVSNYWIIEKNVVYGNGNTTEMGNGIEIFNGDRDGYARYNTIRYNEVYGQISGFNDGTAIAADDYSRYIDIYYNITYDNDGPGIGVWRSKDVNVFNNTCYSNSQNSSGTRTTLTEISVGAFAAGEVSNIVIKNNVAQATEANTSAIHLDVNAYNSSGLDLTNNDWYSSATNWYFWNKSWGNNLATWNAFTGVGTDLNSDPLIIDPGNRSFSIKGISPCRDAGTNLGLSQDYKGNPIIGTPDIGAYECQGPVKPQNARLIKP